MEDGDTFTLQSGATVRLLGVNAWDRGDSRFERAKKFLNDEIALKIVSLEYDRYQDDKAVSKILFLFEDTA